MLKKKKSEGYSEKGIVWYDWDWRLAGWSLEQGWSNTNSLVESDEEWKKDDVLKLRFFFN